MSKQGRVRINTLPTGVHGLDEILGGGLPEFSFNVITGGPGTGKTTMAHQIVFANASVEHPALYFTILGEPVIKMFRYQQQYNFFDESKVGSAVRFVNLAKPLLEQGLDAVLEAITQSVATTNPGVVVVDSFCAFLRSGSPQESRLELQFFLQRLALLLTSWQATTFLVGDYSEEYEGYHSIYSVADGLIRLSQNAERNSVVRKLQVVKLRGQGSVSGQHTVRISDLGMEAFSRTHGLSEHKSKPHPRHRLSIGVPALDLMLGGGVLKGDSIMIAGASGTGKTVLATHFIAEGISQGESGIIAVFEERPDDYSARAGSLDIDLEAPRSAKQLEILYLRPIDLSVDEIMQAILDAVERLGATRLVIDSLAGFEMALAPAFRVEFRESLYRMISALTGAGVTILSTVELEESFTEFPFSQYAISFLTDDIIRLRYVEIEGKLSKVLVVIKMRGSDHSKEIREYDIGAAGFVLNPPLPPEYFRWVTGLPELRTQRLRSETKVRE